MALGHHRDDILETFFLNLFFGGKLKAMPPKLKSDDGENILIRPLAYCKEKDIAAYAEVEDFPSFPATCVGPKTICRGRWSRRCFKNGIGLILGAPKLCFEP